MRDGGTKSAAILIGGPDGLAPHVRDAAQLVLSLGAITLPHGLARIVLAEQLYRAATILVRPSLSSGLIAGQPARMLNLDNHIQVLLFNACMPMQSLRLASCAAERSPSAEHSRAPRPGAAA